MNRFVVALGAMLALPSNGMAQAAPPPPAPPKIVWDIEWQDSSCTMSTGDIKKLALSLWMTPGDPDPLLIIVGSPKLLPDDFRAARVELAPGGESFPVQIVQNAVWSPNVLRLYKLRHNFLPAFAKASEVRLLTGRITVSVPIPGTVKAMAAMKECIDDALTLWGVDSKVFGALKKPPTNIEGYHWITSLDYPREALDRNAQGDVVARLKVDATGKVTDCAVVVKSGSADLDSWVCNLALKKGKFDPAIGPDGQVTSASRVVRIKFRIAS